MAINDTRRRYWSEYYPKNKERIKAHKRSVRGRESTRKYKTGTAGKACRNRYRKRKLMRDPNWKLGYYMSNLLRSSLRKQRVVKNNRAVNLLGCSLDSFRLYLATKFESGMSWENYGNKHGQWTIDHIIPISLFDLSNPEHLKVCFHFSNMQPMWHIENIRKSNHVTEDRQMGLPITGL